MRWLWIVAALWASVAVAEVRLYRPDSAGLEAVGERVDSVRGVLENLHETMNREAGGTVVAHIAFKQCGQENAFFEPSTKGIVICYELIQAYERRNAGNEGAALVATVYAVLHEYGHAVSLAKGGAAVFANQEESADAIAAAIIRKAGMGHQFLPAIMGAMRGALFRDIEKIGVVDEHGYDMKRRANALCWIAGGDTAVMSEAVGRGYITPGRAAQCGREAELIGRRVDQIMALNTPSLVGQAGW